MNRSQTLFFFALAAFSTSILPAARAGSSFEIGDATHSLTAERLRTAIHATATESEVAKQAHETIQAHPAMDQAIKDSLHASVDDILNARTIDLQITFLTGYPDLASLCIEGHPTRNLAIEACANTLILVAGFSAAVNYRWDLFVKATESGRVHYLAAGPGFGAHVNFQTPVFMGPTDYPYNNTTLDAKASLEYVYWMAKNFGFTMQFDLGLSYFIAEADHPMANTVRPGAKLSIGLAF